ncbi:AMP-binding domain-containing protein [Haematococcus lacustris]|uniref:AMP-binding domain-containing protein n=1 Tax=Haematococcus lacustris TaxID=44745 RepID=A0A699ZT71_HAELA|nr:AMP-binding domain-containing protein [Haematococcus lacustris]
MADTPWHCLALPAAQRRGLQTPGPLPVLPAACTHLRQALRPASTAGKAEGMRQGSVQQQQQRQWSGACRLCDDCSGSGSSSDDRKYVASGPKPVRWMPWVTLWPEVTHWPEGGEDGLPAGWAMSWAASSGLPDLGPKEGGQAGRQATSHLAVQCIGQLAWLAWIVGDIAKLVDDISALQPAMFVGVPRVFDRIYARITDQVGGPGS